MIIYYYLQFNKNKWYKCINYIRIILLQDMQISDDPSGLSQMLREMKSNFDTGLRGKSISHRKMILRTLLDAYDQFQGQFNEALQKDLGYSTFMSDFLAHGIIRSEVGHLIDGLSEWAATKSVPTTLIVGMAKSQIKHQPLGVVLVVSAWNYPIYTSLPQVAAAMSAGNAVVLKPSELAPHCSKVLKRMFDKHFDSKYYRVVEGKVQVAKSITKLPFDLICFTGSTQTGRLVAMAAANNLTPCLLELGGKCPVIIDASANIESAAMRILVGKFMNCGQTCIGVDHVFVHQSVKAKFQQAVLRHAKVFYQAEDVKVSGNYGKIINQFHFKRIEKLLKDDHKGEVIFGGTTNIEERFISPTIIVEPSEDALLMQEEIFGPLLPIFSYTDIQNVIRKVNAQAKPLVVYLFSENTANIRLVQNSTSSGTFVVNDTVVQMLNPNLPFGGVGGSGYGRYHGESGFKAFSNEKSILKSKPYNMFPLNQRFPPYTLDKQKKLKFLLKIGGVTYSKIGMVVLISAIIIVGVALAIAFIPK